MRTLRLALTSLVLATLGWGSGGVAAASSDPEVAWATIRDGAFGHPAEWEARFAQFDPGNETQVRQLRRSVAADLAILEGAGDPYDDHHACYAEAYEVVSSGASTLRRGLRAFLKERPERGAEEFAQGQERLREYWTLRDEVDCSTSGQVAAFLDRENEYRSSYREVTGRRVQFEYVDSDEEPRFVDNAVRVDGDTTHERWKWSDPFLPPDLTNQMNMANYSLGWEGRVIVSSLLLEDPEGYWTGTGYGHFADPKGPFGHGLSLLEGHGVYEGLSAILTSTADTDADTLTVVGAIYGGPLPPVPEPLVPGDR